MAHIIRTMSSDEATMRQFVCSIPTWDLCALKQLYVCFFFIICCLLFYLRCFIFNGVFQDFFSVFFLVILLFLSRTDIYVHAHACTGAHTHTHRVANVCIYVCTCVYTSRYTIMYTRTDEDRFIWKRMWRKGNTYRKYCIEFETYFTIIRIYTLEN